MVIDEETQTWTLSSQIFTCLFCSLMEKTYRNMAYKIQNNGLRCTLYEGVRLQCTLQWGN